MNLAEIAQHFHDYKSKKKKKLRFYSEKDDKNFESSKYFPAITLVYKKILLNKQYIFTLIKGHRT